MADGVVIRKCDFKCLLFEAARPISLDQHIQYWENSLLLQFTLEHKGEQALFVNKVNFYASSSELEVEDLNRVKQRDIFDQTTVFRPGERRNYLFVVQPKDP